MTESEKRIPPFGLRLPADLKARVQAAAQRNNRSMNAEIIAMIEMAFELENVVEKHWETISVLTRAVDVLDRVEARIEKENDDPQAG